MRPRLDPRRDDEHVHAEGRDAQLLPHLAEDAVAHLLDRPERVSHRRGTLPPWASSSTRRSLRSTPTSRTSTASSTGPRQTTRCMPSLTSWSGLSATTYPVA